MSTRQPSRAIPIPAVIVASRRGLFETIASVAVHQDAHDAGRRTLLKAAGSVAALSVAGVARAQAFPSRRITLLCAFPPGGTADAVARSLAFELEEILKQTVIVDTRPGGSQSIASAYLTRQPPDGYHIMIQPLPNMLPPSLLKSLPYNGNTDFAAVAPVARVGALLSLSTKLPASNVSEFIALLKANPGKYKYGFTGIGTPLHIWMEMMHVPLGVKQVGIPYRSYPEMLGGVINGDIDYSFVSFSALEFVKAGKLKVIGFTGNTREPAFPQFPTLEEAGLKGYNEMQLYTIVTTKGTPPEIIQRLNTAIATAVARPSFAARFSSFGGILPMAPLAPAQTGELIVREEEKYKFLLTDNHIKFE